MWLILITFLKASGEAVDSGPGDAGPPGSNPSRTEAISVQSFHVLYMSEWVFLHVLQFPSQSKKIHVQLDCRLIDLGH